MLTLYHSRGGIITVSTLEGLAYPLTTHLPTTHILGKVSGRPEFLRKVLSYPGTHVSFFPDRHFDINLDQHHKINSSGLYIYIITQYIVKVFVFVTRAVILRLINFYRFLLPT